MKKLIWILCSMLVSLTTLAQNRNVVWVHGLRDAEDFWEEYVATFNSQRQITSSNVKYETTLGIGVMAPQVSARMSTNTQAAANTIGIGHSMGGIALREIDRNPAPRRAGGYITFGAPLNGVRVVDAYQRGEVDAYLDNGINEVTKGPLRQSLGLGFIVVTLSTISRSFTAKGIIDLLSEITYDRATMAQFSDQGSRDLAEGSTYMRGTNGTNGARMYSTNTPKISIYGNENSPVHYRLASSTGGDDDDDRKYVDILSKAEAVYNAQYIHNLATAPINPLNA